MNKLIAALLLGGIVTLPLPGQTAPAPDSTDLYYMVFLRPAAERQSLSKEEGERLQSAHMANIRSMAERGVLVAAGPFGDKTPSISGVFLFKTGSLEEARATAAQDPTVVEHRNSVEAFAWRGPKGIGDEYARLHKANPKTPEDMGVQPLCMLFRGASWDRQQSERAPVLRAHDGYVASLRRDRKLSAAGPIEGNGDLLAILIFNRIPDEEAQRLIGEDPAVKAGLLRAEYHRWWSAAHVLPE